MMLKIWQKNLKKIIKLGAWTLPEVIAEVIYVLNSVYKIEREEIANAILEILKEIDIEHKKNCY